MKTRCEGCGAWVDWGPATSPPIGKSAILETKWAPKNPVICERCGRVYRGKAPAADVVGS